MNISLTNIPRRTVVLAVALGLAIGLRMEFRHQWVSRTAFPVVIIGERDVKLSRRIFFSYVLPQFQKFLLDRKSGLHTKEFNIQDPRPQVWAIWDDLTESEKKELTLLLGYPHAIQQDEFLFGPQPSLYNDPNVTWQYSDPFPRFY